MEALILIMSICCVIPSLFWLVAKISAPNLLVLMVAKFIAIMGIITPILYWFKLGGII